MGSALTGAARGWVEVILPQPSKRLLAPTSSLQSKRPGSRAQALKRLLAVEKHFEDFVEDQFDFHSYCVRKMTLRSYVEMLRMEDRVHASIFFAKVRPWAGGRPICMCMKKKRS